MEKLNSCLSSENKDYEHVDRVVSNENRNILAPLPYEFAETACTERHVSESTENILKLLEPIISTIKLSSRPKVTPFKFRHGRKGVVRIASWNIERFDQEKADNPGVKEVICMTILEKGFSLIAFQELADKKALEKICEELNNPSLSCTKNWSGHRGEWQYLVSDATGRMFRSMEYNGFLYDIARGITLNHSALLENQITHLNHLLGHHLLELLSMLLEAIIDRRQLSNQRFLMIKKFDCIIVSVHLKATGLGNEDLERLQREIDKVPEVIDAIEKHYPGEEDIIILGDFNLDPKEEDFDIMREKGYSNCVPVDEFTNISNSNPEGSQIYDHIWISSRTNNSFSGNSGVIRENLTSPLIPNGWSWGGVVSDHCPVWTELYTGKDYDSADLRIIPDTNFTLTG